MLVSSLISAIRPLVGDENSTRYTDDRILDIINEAQRDLVKKTGMLVTKSEIALVAEQADYTLPSDLYSLSRVTVGGIRIPFSSTSLMDEKSDSWENVVGTSPEYIIYDQSNLDEIRVYPIPSTVTLVSEPPTTTLEGSMPYGAFMGYSSDTNTSGVINGTLQITYQRKPTDGTIGNSLDNDIDNIYKEVVVYYCASVLLLESHNDREVSRGTMYQGKYTEEINNLIVNKATNFSTSNNRNSTYRSGFNG
jgi:hypothetical protein